MQNQDIFFSVFIGDSLSMPRHAEGVEIEDTYAFLLHQYWQGKYGKAHNLTFSFPGKTVSVAASSFQDYIRNYAGPRELDVAVVQLGIVDSAIRVMPARLHALVSRLPAFLRQPIINFLHKNRPRLQRMGFTFRYTNPADFKEIFSGFIKQLSGLSKKTFIITIAPGTEAVYRQSPGVKESIILYNEMIKEISESCSGTGVIDVYDNFAADPEKYLTNDLHMTREGHRYIFSQIIGSETA